jgi:hypothetical protein
MMVRGHGVLAYSTVAPVQYEATHQTKCTDRGYRSRAYTTAGAAGAGVRSCREATLINLCLPVYNGGLVCTIVAPVHQPRWYRVVLIVYTDSGRAYTTAGAGRATGQPYTTTVACSNIDGLAIVRGCTRRAVAS